MIVQLGFKVSITCNNGWHLAIDEDTETCRFTVDIIEPHTYTMQDKVSKLFVSFSYWLLMYITV